MNIHHTIWHIKHAQQSAPSYQKVTLSILFLKVCTNVSSPTPQLSLILIHSDINDDLDFNVSFHWHDSDKHEWKHVILKLHSKNALLFPHLPSKSCANSEYGKKKGYLPVTMVLRVDLCEFTHMGLVCACADILGALQS